MIYNGYEIPDSEINGCGSGGWKIVIKEFEPFCKMHDAEYYLAFDTRQKIDFVFMCRCLTKAKEVQESRFLRGLLLRFLAYFFYVMVRIFGAKYYKT